MLFSDLLLETACAGEVKFNAGEIHLIENTDIGAFPKSCLVFRAAGLVDECFREELRRGIQPWNAHLAENIWIYNPQICPIGSLTIQEAIVKWQANLKYWTSITVKNPSIAIFNQNNSSTQLGVRLNSRTHAGNMIDHLRGFLHPIDSLCYNQLRAMGY